MPLPASSTRDMGVRSATACRGLLITGSTYQIAAPVLNLAGAAGEAGGVTERGRKAAVAKRTQHQIDIDDALTKSINSEEVIYAFLAERSARLHQKFQGDHRYFFYVKGSAALSRYLKSQKLDAELVDKICARSDWDTQLVINPWLSQAEWFSVFRKCYAVILEQLDQYEEELLPAFARLTGLDQGVDPRELGGKTSDHEVRGKQRELAKRVRKEIAAAFARVFAKTSEEKNFHQHEHENYWNLRWENIAKIWHEKRPWDLLDLEIQGHHQATLTSALIHPGQALDNLNSILTGAELARLRDTTRAVAEETWDQMSVASDEYDQLRLKLISSNPEIIGVLKKKFPASQPSLDLVRSLPDEITTELIKPLPDNSYLNKLWERIQTAKYQRRISGDGTSPLEINFGNSLINALKGSPSVVGKLRDWCFANLMGYPAVLTALAEASNKAINKAIVEHLDQEAAARLERARARVDELFDQYREDPDPEDVAEAEKRETEQLAPFALVEQEKGSRKVGSILENMSIRDFYLFRLMIRCQLSNRDPDNRLIPEAPPGMSFDTFKQQFKFRAELLDISVPRDDTVEAAEQWRHTRYQITVDQDGIPLPNGDYFLDEYVLMFREVLDKKSSSMHKLTKRLQRACLIAHAFVNEQGPARLTERATRLADRFPLFRELATDKKTLPPNAVVFMRICEQLVETYDLAYNEALRGDVEIMMRANKEHIVDLLSTPLAEQTFLAFMRLYDHLGRVIYNHAFVLAGLRRKRMPDQHLALIANQIMQIIGTDFAPDQARCAVVEDFAIVHEPDLPTSLKERLPCDVLKLVMYTTADVAEKAREVISSLSARLRLDGATDAKFENDSLYVWTNQDVNIILSQGAKDISYHHVENAGSRRKALILRLDLIVDDAVHNWVAPAHERDLKAIVKHYRRSLANSSEYYAVTQKKAILRELEKALTTY